MNSAVATVRTEFSGVAEIRPHRRTQNRKPFIAANVIIEGAPGGTALIYLTNFRNQAIHFPQKMRVAYACRKDEPIYLSTESTMSDLFDAAIKKDGNQTMDTGRDCIPKNLARNPNS